MNYECFCVYDILYITLTMFRKFMLIINYYANNLKKKENMAVNLLNRKSQRRTQLLQKIYLLIFSKNECKRVVQKLIK